MLHALAWSVIAVLALIWSLLAWPAHALAGLAAAAPVLEWTLALVPGLAGWLPPLVLVAWIAGLVVLILAGAACSIAIRLFAGRAHAKL